MAYEKVSVCSLFEYICVQVYFMRLSTFITALNSVINECYIVANFASMSLVMGYVTSIVLGACNMKSFNPIPMIGGHTALLTYFLYNYNILLKSNRNGSSNSVSGSADASKNDLNLVSVKIFYKSIWNLFYLEYCLYPFI